MILQEQTDKMAWYKARAEQRAIENAGEEKALGSNAEARQRALTLALWSDGEYTRAYQERQETEREINDLQVQLEALLDERRQEEWRVRARLVDALTGHGLDHPGNGTGSTIVATEAVTRGAMNELERTGDVPARVQREIDELYPF